MNSFQLLSKLQYNSSTTLPVYPTHISQCLHSSVHNKATETYTCRDITKPVNLRRYIYNTVEYLHLENQCCEYNAEVVVLQNDFHLFTPFFMVGTVSNTDFAMSLPTVA